MRIGPKLLQRPSAERPFEPDPSATTDVRNFKLNWIRAVSTWTAFALFLAALVESL